MVKKCVDPYWSNKNDMWEPIKDIDIDKKVKTKSFQVVS